MKGDRTVITYKKGEDYIKDYVNSKSGPGAFIKDLLIREMKKEIKEGTYIQKEDL